MSFAINPEAGLGLLKLRLSKVGMRWVQFIGPSTSAVLPTAKPITMGLKTTILSPQPPPHSILTSHRYSNFRGFRRLPSWISRSKATQWSRNLRLACNIVELLHPRQQGILSRFTSGGRHQEFQGDGIISKKTLMMRWVRLSLRASFKYSCSELAN
jgi:hypothetical protein